MLIYAGLLFMCTFVLTYQQNHIGGGHIPGSGHKSHHNGSRVDGSHFHNHTFGRKAFPHAGHDGRPAHHNLPAKDQWDRELQAKLSPLMKKKPQPYLAYLDLWRLKKGQKSNSYDQEKDRFIYFVEEVNRKLEHKMKVALGPNPEALKTTPAIVLGSIVSIDRGSSDINQNRAAQNPPWTGNNVLPAWNTGDSPRGNENVVHWPGDGEGKVNLLTLVR